MLFSALAGGMAWGIRGQYGHETGAMIAGLLVSLVLTLLLCPQIRSLAAARAVGLCTLAMGFGGSMTYGQTVGLTHDPELVGNYGALAWGMLGLALKGGIWIGFAGIFLGMGLSGVRYRAWEMLLLMLSMLALSYVGVFLFNEPFDPAHKTLPLIYFSDDWYWEPGSDLKPRREVWGGLITALAGSIAYVFFTRRDTLAVSMACWGFLGGAMGFPLGQSLQSFHAWHREFFRMGAWRSIDSVINWWNLMETTFGAVMGAILGLGLWLNRRHIFGQVKPVSSEDVATSMPPAVEWLLVVIHVGLLLCAEFSVYPALRGVYGFGLVMGLIPAVAVASGRWWPYLMMLPIIAIPIMGKTLRNLAYEEKIIPIEQGWWMYVAVPLSIVAIAAVALTVASYRKPPARNMLRLVLLLMAWLFYGLNFAFFKFPWPWETWTARTPNALVFTVCVVGISALVWQSRGSNPAHAAPT